MRSLQHGGRVTQVAFVDADRLLTASEDGTARLWRVDDGALLASFTHGAPVRAAFVDAAGRVFTAGDDGVLRCWTAGGRLLWASKPGAPIAAAAAGPSGAVATAGTDGVVRIWRAADGRLLHDVARPQRSRRRRGVQPGRPPARHRRRRHDRAHLGHRDRERCGTRSRRTRSA